MHLLALELRKVKKIRQEYKKVTGREITEDLPSLAGLVQEGVSAKEVAHRVANRN